MATTFLLFPNHLFKEVSKFPKDTVFCLIEEAHFFRRFAFHKHKLVFHRASMQALRERLLTRGFEVLYFDALTYPKLEDVIKVLLEKGQANFEMYASLDKNLDRSLQSLMKKYDFFIQKRPFLNFFSLSNLKLSLGRKRFIDGFVQALTAKEKRPSTPLIIEHDRYIEEAISYVNTVFPRNPGKAEDFAYPVTYNDAEEWLEHGVRVGTLLNCGLLTIQQVLKQLEIGVPQPEQLLKELGEREYAYLTYTNQESSVEKSILASAMSKDLDAYEWVKAV